MVPKKTARQSPVVVDLFAGCGGLSLGLEMAGFLPAFVNEINDDARETYLMNRRERFPHLDDALFQSADVQEMLSNATCIPDFLDELRHRLFGGRDDVDLVVGGPPCQGFSGIGHRRSYAVPKSRLPANRLYQDMAEVIRRMRPRAFLFENVRGLLHGRWSARGKKGEIWSDVFRTFSEIDGYAVAAGLVYARDYRVPQNRPRVLLVGIRNDISRLEGQSSATQLDAVDRGFLPAPLQISPPNLEELLDDLVDEENENGGESTRYPREPNGEVQTWFRTALDGHVLGGDDRLWEQVYTKHSDLVRKKFESMLKNEGRIPEKYQTRKFAQRLLPPIWKNGPTITATSLPDDYVHYRRPRILTVREWARLQGFPDWYRFAGKRTTGGLRRAGNPRKGQFERELPKYTQIGNAVPVRLAEEVGKHLRMLLEGG